MKNFAKSIYRLGRVLTAVSLSVSLFLFSGTVSPQMVSADPTVPEAPYGLTAVVVSATQVDLSWTDNSTNENRFRIERAADGAFTTALATSNVTQDVTTYVDNSVGLGVTYYYRVAAVNGAGENVSAYVSVTAFAPSATPSVASGGGGGGGGSIAPATSAVNISGLSGAELKVDSNGYAVGSAEFENAAKDCKLSIDKGTKLLDADGKPLKTLTHFDVTAPPAPPAGKFLIAAHGFGPDGATFSPPLTLVIKYDPSALPQGTNEADLQIAVWNGSSWQYLTTTIDSVTHTASAQVSHFSKFAVMASAALAPAPPTTSVTPTTPATPTTPTTPTTPPVTPTTPTTPTSPITETPGSAFNWWLVLAVIGAAIVVGVLIFTLRRRSS